MQYFIREFGNLALSYPLETFLLIVIPAGLSAFITYHVGLIEQRRRLRRQSVQARREVLGRLQDLGSCVLAGSPYDYDLILSVDLPDVLADPVEHVKDLARSYYVTLRKAEQLDPGELELYAKRYPNVGEAKVNLMWHEAKDKYVACRAQAASLRTSIINAISDINELLGLQQDTAAVNELTGATARAE